MAHKPFGPLEVYLGQCPWAAFPRKRLDIDYADLRFALMSILSIAETERSFYIHEIERRWCQMQGMSQSPLICLSVRTAFDLYFQHMQFPKGSQIICSAITIPDMIHVIKYHGLVPVPVDIDLDTMTADGQTMMDYVTPKTVAVLIAHIFGTYNSIAPTIDLFRMHHPHIHIVEDCAQAYTGIPREPSGADMTMYSFGTIKTSTAFGGAIIEIKDQELYEALKKRNEEYPVRPRMQFFKRVIKYAVLHGASTPAIFGLVLSICQKLGIPHDDIITAAIRGFSGGDLITLIRFQPSVPLLTLLNRRLVNEDGAYVQARRHNCAEMVKRLEKIEGVRIPGLDALEHHYWLLPIQVEHPAQVAKFMTQNGFDVTSGATQLTFIPVDPSIEQWVPEPVHAKTLMKSLVYLPITPELSKSILDQMLCSLKNALSACRGPISRL